MKSLKSLVRPQHFYGIYVDFASGWQNHARVNVMGEPVTSVTSPIAQRISYGWFSRFLCIYGGENGEGS